MLKGPFLWAMVALLAFVAPPRDLVAQVEPPEPGTYAVSFEFPSSDSGEFGVRKVLESGVNAGLNVSFLFNRASSDRQGTGEDTRTRWSLGIGPDFRFYREARGAVLPFLFLNGRISYEDHNDDVWSGGISGGTGVGVEWFPVTSMSVSGATGVGLSYSRSDSDMSGTTTSNTTVSSFTSSLAVNIYF